MSPNVDDLKQSNFLTQKDVKKPLLVTIKNYSKVNVAKEGADPEYRYVLNFNELDKPMTLNVTNGNLIRAITGSGNFDDWIGYKIVLFIDTTVMYAGEMVGGIRCRAPKNQPAQKPVESPTQTREERAAQDVTDDVAAEQEDDVPF